MTPISRFDSSESRGSAVEVALGALGVAEHPDYLVTKALGSCVGIALWDSVLHRGALAHSMLPTPVSHQHPGNSERFVVFALPEMVRRLEALGSKRRSLVAKIAGGSAMFQFDGLLAGIGERNAAEARNQLRLLKIPLIAEDIGERHARTVELHLDTGLFLVRSYVYGVIKL